MRSKNVFDLQNTSEIVFVFPFLDQFQFSQKELNGKWSKSKRIHQTVNTGDKRKINAMKRFHEFILQLTLNYFSLMHKQKKNKCEQPAVSVFAIVLHANSTLYRNEYAFHTFGGKTYFKHCFDFLLCCRKHIEIPI